MELKKYINICFFQMKINVSQTIRFYRNEMPPTEERDEILEFIKILQGYCKG